MKNILLSCCIAIGILYSLDAQEPFYKSFDWKIYTWEVADKEAPKSIIDQHVVVEFISEGEDFIEYFFSHKVEYINHEDEVGKNNKKYIPIYGVAELVDAKARVVKMNKTVLELDDSQILESVDEETGLKSWYFALEGLAQGDVIDYYYVIRKNPNYNGTFKNIQQEYPIQHYEFSLYCPDHLEFTFNLKNDSTEIKKDTLDEVKNHWFFEIDSIPALKREESAPYNALRKHVLYKLDNNTATSKTNIVNYSVASQNIYSNIYENLGKDELKALDKFFKKISVEINIATDSAIRTIEDYIKGNISFVDVKNPNLDNLDFAVANKAASSYGLTKLFAQAFKRFGIKHEIVLTSTRGLQYFDPDFESYHYLSKYLFFFPETKSYLIPDAFEYRYNLIPAAYTDNLGLFIKEVSIGDFSSGIGKIKKIEPLPYKSTHHNLDIQATINNDFSNVDLKIKQSSLGYFAIYLQPYIDLMSTDEYKELGKVYLESIMENLESDDWRFIHGGAHKMQRSPLIFEVNGRNEHLIDFAGDKYLFKVGLVVGPQVEMYSEGQRVLPLHDDYKREFIRHIEVDIPDGYEIKNPEDLKIKSDFVKDGKQVLLFESNYKIDGQKLSIEINEFYDQLFYTLDEYPKYLDVVNSAADFNKVTLILDKVE